MKGKPEIAIKVNNVSKTFSVPTERRESIKSYFLSPFRRVQKKRFEALKNVNFEVKKGEFLGIIGRNGSGKSTLLKLIAGIYQPDEGNITVNGKIVPFLELGVGFNPELSGRENIFLNGTILGMSRKYLEEKFDEIVDFAELREFLDLPLKNYSSGMQVRLAFSIAVQTNADIYILDEILAVGDVNFQERSYQVLNNLRKKKKTIIYVSHDLQSVQNFCDSAVLLREGRTEESGDPQKVVYEYLNSLEEKEQYSDDGSNKRWGNQKVTIEDVTFLNDNNEKCKVFRTGETLKIKIRYKTENKVINPNFGVAIFNREGSYCYGVNTYIDKKTPREIMGEGEIIVRYPKMMLLKGVYTIDVAVFGASESEVYDFHSKEYSFRVVNNMDDQGIVYLNHEWIFDDEVSKTKN